MIYTQHTEIVEIPDTRQMTNLYLAIVTRKALMLKH